MVQLRFLSIALTFWISVAANALAASLRAPDNPTGTQAGLNYLYYTASGTGGVLPDFTQLFPAKSGQVSNFDISVRTQDTNFSFQFLGYVTVPSAGTYTFYTSSDDGSRLYIGNTLVVDNNFSQGQTERSGTIGLQAGTHQITVQYGQGSSLFALSVSYAGPTTTKQTIPNSALSCIPSTVTYKQPENPVGSIQGVLYKFYTSSGSGGVLPDFTTITPASSGVLTNFLLDPRTTDTNISFEYTGYISIPMQATWTFYTSSDDGSRLFIGPYLVVDNNYSQGQTERSGTIALAAGIHAIKVQYGQGNGGFGLSVSYQGGNLAKQTIPNAVLSYLPLTPTPVIAPGTPKIPTPTFSLTLSDSTAGAAIYYTTDGSTPTTASTLYSGPVTLSTPVTVNAVAKASGFDTSFVASASFVTALPPANDNFATAIVLSGTLPITASGSNLNATWETGEPNHGGGDGQKSIWYKWVAPAAGSYSVSTSGSAIDTTLAVYTGTAVNALTLIGQNDDANGDNPSPTTASSSLVTFQASAGTTYYIAIDGFAGAEGNTTLTLSQGPTLSVVATTPNASEAGLVSGLFTITRTGDTTSAFICNFSLDGTATKTINYLRVDEFISFAAGQATATVTVKPVENFLYNGPLTVVLTLSPSDYAQLDPTKTSATVTIADNDSVTSGTVKDTSFNPKRGFYSAPIDVAVTTATSGASIRYTLDGTLPTPAYGTVYTGPIHITKTTALRAIAYKAGLNPTNADTQTYLFTSDIITQPATAPNSLWPAAGTISPVSQVINYGMDPNITTNALWSGTIQNDLKTIPSFCVSVNPSDLFGSSQGIYANPSGDSFTWERPCALELIDPNNTANNFGGLCGIRLRGGYSRNPGNPKHAFRFFYRSDYNKGTLQQPIFGPAPAQQKIDAFDLRCDQNYSWSFGGDRSNECFIRDNFSRDSQLAVSGFGCRGDYYHLYINGTYWGLYNTDERGEAGWAANYFGGSKSDYDVVKSQSDTGYTIYATDGDMNAWTRLWKACKAGLSSNAAYYKIQGKNADGTPNPTYENLLEVDDLIDYMLVIYYGGNLDSPISQFLNNQSPNNFFAQRNRNGNSGFRFTIHDAEHTLLDVNQNRLGPWPAGDTLDKSNPQWIFQQCEANAEFRIKVADHLRRHFFNGGAFTPTPCIARFSARMTQLDRAVVGESARWGDAQTTPACNRNDWLAVCNNILSNYFPARTQIVINQFIAAGLYPNLGAPNFSQYGGAITPGFACSITNPNATGRIYYTLDGSDPRRVGGAIAPTAIAGGTATSNVTMNGTVTLRARVYDGSNWSALQDSTFTAPQDFSTLKVTEIMYNPPDFNGVDGQEFEFFEMKNTGSVALNLSGATFVSGIGYTFPAGAVVNPGQIIVLVANPSQFALKYPGVTPFGTYTGRLNNSGDTLTLNYSTGTTIFSFAYQDVAPWPVVADGLGFSLVPNEGAVSTGLGDVNYWRASTNAGGSPGADDPIATRGKILINEALTHVTPPNNEYIELYNAGTTTVDLSGWYLTDDRHTPQKFRIPNGTSLPAGGYVAFLDTQYNPNPGVAPSFALDSHGEEVFVFSANSTTGALTGYAHGFKFGAAQNPVAFGRYTISTGADHFVAQSSNTPGALNSGPRVGPIVFSEVMYQPATGGDQFIELLNITSASVPLYDPLNPANTWQIDGIGFSFPQNVTLSANSLALIVGIDPTAFRNKYNIAAAIPIYGPWTGTLSTAGMHIELQKPDNPDPVAGGGTYVPYVAVEALDYTPSAPWPLEPAGTGPSLTRINALTYGNDPINWKKSPNNGGSPGTSDALIPTPPAGLAAGAVSSSAIALSWIDNASNESTFNVQRSLDGTSWTTLPALGANVTSYQDNGLTPSTLYYYRVYASNAFGDSKPSNVASATTQAPPPPNPPTVLVAIQMTQSKLRLEWSDGSDNETGFKVERSPNGSDSWTEMGQTPSDTTIYVDQGLSADTTYYYRVRAYNPYGYSTYTNVASGHTQTARIFQGHTSGAFVRGHKGSIFADLTSPGNEQQVTFSLGYDAALLANPVVVAASGLGPNTVMSSQIAGNTIGITLSATNGSTLSSGLKTLVEIRFDTLASGNALSTAVVFGDSPTPRAVLDGAAQPMEVSASQNIAVTILPNTSPVAASGALTVTEDQPKSGTLSASDAESDPLIYTIVDPPSKGSVTITNTSTGAFTYTPTLYVNGADTFTFKASDGIADSNVATISVNITAVNHASTAQPSTVNVNEDSSVQAALLAADVDNDVLTYTIVAPPSKGMVQITNAATGTFKYTPSPLTHGTDGFTFKVNDGTIDSNVASVSISIAHVNHPPTAGNGTLNVNEDGSAQSTLAASDADGDSLTYSIVSQPTKGSVTITNTSTGTFTYSPNPITHGTDSFTFKVNDGTTDSNVASVSISIAHVNHPPTSGNGTLNVNEDGSAQSTLAASDADGDALTYSIVSQPTKGSVTITNASTGTFTYSPNPITHGTDSFTFKVNDGTIDSNVASVSISIAHVNHPPVAANGTLTVNEESSAQGVIVATDADQDALTFSVVAQPAHGTVKITNSFTGAYTYTPSSLAFGVDSFTFKVFDGAVDSNTASIAITIIPINHAPTVLGTSLTTLDSQPVSGVLSAHDPDGDALLFHLVSNGTLGTAAIVDASAGTFTYTPSGAATGIDTFMVAANDGSTDSIPATVTVTILPTPIALTSPAQISGNTREDFQFPLTAIGTAPIRYSATGLPAGLTLNGSNISGVPTAAGIYTVAVTAENGSTSQMQNLVITIVNTGGPANQPPRVISGPSVSSNPALINQPVTFSAAATDADGDQLIYTWDFGDGTSGTGASCPHVYTTVGNQLVTLTVSDGAKSDTHTLLCAVNDPAQTSFSTLVILKAQLTVNFSKSPLDSAQISGSAPVSVGANALGMDAIVWIGNRSFAMKLDAHGKGGGRNVSIKLSDVKNGVFKSGASPFTFSATKELLLDAVKEYGIVNANVTHSTVMIPIAITVGTNSFTSTVTLNYTSKAGKTGTGKGE